jgi:hypothetical protein
MKKLLLVAYLIIGICVYSFAQNPSFGFTGGVSIANVREKVPGKAVHSDSRVGFTIGAFLEHKYNAHFSFQPALNFVQKGGKGSNSDITYDYKFSYLELPLDFLYNLKAGSGRFFIGGGPWFAAGLGGKSKIDDGTGAKNSDIKFGNDNAKADLRTFELGGDILAGFKMKGGFLLSANYSFSLHNITFDALDKLMNYYIGLKVGYQMPPKKAK